jgi:hypothetical protein
MFNEHVILILIIGGFTGWLGLGIMAYYIFNHDVKEIEMIKEIRQELKIIKEEIKELK